MTAVSLEIPRPRVFISYAHESADHKRDVRDLWVFLLSKGIDAVLDRVAAAERQHWPLWTEQQIRLADFVLVIASKGYRERAEGVLSGRSGKGVKYETYLLAGLLYEDTATWQRKILPVILPGHSPDDIPGYLTVAASRYEVPALTEAGADALLRTLTGQPEDVAPPLGDLPVLPPAHHRVVVRVAEENGLMTTTATTGGDSLGARTSPVPVAATGDALFRAMFSPHTATRLLRLIDGGSAGSTVHLRFEVADSVRQLPYSELVLPDGRRIAAIAGLRFGGVSRSLNTAVVAAMIAASPLISKSVHGFTDVLGHGSGHPGAGHDGHGHHDSGGHGDGDDHLPGHHQSHHGHHGQHGHHGHHEVPEDLPQDVQDFIEFLSEQYEDDDTDLDDVDQEDDDDDAY